jgi:ATP-dependent DNA helicase RecG
LLPDITVETINDKAVLVIQIEHVPSPHYLSDKGIEKSVYLRMGSSNHLASAENIEELKRAGNYESFDKQPCDHVKEIDLDMDRIKTIYKKSGRVIDTQKLMSVGILTKKNGLLLATNGGVILFGSPIIREQYFPYAEVRCARFQGSSRSEFIDRLNIEGGILAAIDEVPKFIRRNTKMAGKFGNMKRRDISEYPAEGIREALINALVHANYEISGSRIFIAIYDDRLEVQNPGVMLPGMSIEQFKAGVSRIRNPVIARIFGKMGLVEEWGSGYERIRNACVNGGYPEPKWEEFGSALRVTFYPHPEMISQQSELGAGVGTQSAPSWHPVEEYANLNAEMIKLMDFCHESKGFQALLQYMGWKDRTKFRRQFISPLLELGLIERTIPEKPNSSKQEYFVTNIGRNVLEKIKKR